MGSSQTEQLQNDIRLIQEVERHTNLYDPRCKDKDSKSKEHAWAVIGIKLNLPAHICKNRWKNLRDKYTREKKLMMIEGEEMYRSHSWPLLDEMSFLWNFVSHRNRPQELKVKACLIENETCVKHGIQSEWDDVSALDSNEVDNLPLEPNLVPACVLVEEDEQSETSCHESGQPRSKLRKLLEVKEEDASVSRCGTIREVNHNLENVVYAEDSYPYRLMDEEEYFCLSLAASLRRLSKKECSLLKIKILQILHEAQFGES